MKNQSIAVIDSGVGGISVLKKLVKTFPNEHFIYFGDNDNAPYGNLSRHNLLKIAIQSIDVIKKHRIKGIVLACNTLSVSLHNEIQEYSHLPTFCIFPPFEKCQTSKGKTLLLATERTAKNYIQSKNVDIVGLKDLALIIEKNIFNLNAFDFSDYFDKVIKIKEKKGYYQKVILGCTHYNFIKKQIIVHFQPPNLYDGTENLIKMMGRIYQSSKTLEINKRFNVLFIGKNAKLNEYIYNVSGHDV